MEKKDYIRVEVVKDGKSVMVENFVKGSDEAEIIAFVLTQSLTERGNKKCDEVRGKFADILKANGTFTDEEVETLTTNKAIDSFKKAAELVGDDVESFVKNFAAGNPGAMIAMAVFVS